VTAGATRGPWEALDDAAMADSRPIAGLAPPRLRSPRHAHEGRPWLEGPATNDVALEAEPKPSLDMARKSGGPIDASAELILAWSAGVARAAPRASPDRTALAMHRRLGGAQPPLDAARLPYEGRAPLASRRHDDAVAPYTAGRATPVTRDRPRRSSIAACAPAGARPARGPMRGRTERPGSSDDARRSGDRLVGPAAARKVAGTPLLLREDGRHQSTALCADRVPHQGRGRRRGGPVGCVARPERGGHRPTIAGTARSATGRPDRVRMSA